MRPITKKSEMRTGPAIAIVVAFGVLIVGAIVFGIVNVAHVKHRTCTVLDKDRAWVSDGKGSGHSSQRVYTEQCGVLVAGDSWLSWHFNSADTYEALKAGHTYELTTRGFRIPFLSRFPNIVDYREVTR